MLVSFFGVAIWNLGIQPFCWDEAAHALYAREIARNFLYIPPRHRWPKTPPFFHTIEGFGFMLFGETEIIGRLLSVFSSVLTLVVVYKLCSKIFSNIAGLLAVFLLGFNYHFLGYSRMAMAYGLVTFFDTTIVYLFYTSLEKKAFKRLLFAGLFVGLSFITKYSGIIPFLAGLLYITIKSSSLKENKLVVEISNDALKYLVLGIVIAVFVSFSFLKMRIGTVMEYLFWDIDSLLFLPSLAKGAYVEFNPILSVLERLGIYVSIICVSGVLYSIIRRTKEDILFLCWSALPISILLILAPMRFAMRYFIPFFPPIFILGARFISDFANAINRFLIQFGVVKIIRSPKPIILLALIVPQLVSSGVQIPEMVNSEITVDGYWFIHGYKETGLYFRENTTPNITIATNTHQPVLKFYSQRSVSQPISAEDVEEGQADYIVIHASPELVKNIGPFEEGILKTIQDPEYCLELLTNYPSYSETKAYTMVKAFTDEQGNVIVWIFEKNPTLVMVTEAEHTTVSAGVSIDRNLTNDSGDSMTLDFENEWVKYDFVAGSYLLPGKYKTLVRAKDLNQVKDDFVFVFKDFTNEADLSERKFITLGSEFAQYTIDFEIEEEDLMNSVGFWIYKGTQITNTIWIDYVLILRE